MAPTNGCWKFPGWFRRSPTCPWVAPSRRAVLSPTISVASNIRPMRKNGPRTGPPAGTPMRFTELPMLDQDIRRNADTSPPPVLHVHGLKKHFVIRKGTLRRHAGYALAVDAVT